MFNPPPPSASGGVATMTGIRINYRGSIISRRVEAGNGGDDRADPTTAGDLVTTELLSTTAGAPTLHLIDHTVSPAKSSVLQIGVPVALLRGKAEITFDVARLPVQL
jgi:hypothetical protein